MKLRDHPGMSYRGIRNWPPKWTTTRQTRDQLPTGEIGILKYVSMHNDSRSEIILTIESGGRPYRGSLTFEDPWFCSQVYNILQLHVDHAIRDVGDLEIPA
jgi:hypothetical protein